MNTKKKLKLIEETLDNIRSITRVFEHTAARKMDINRQEMDNIAFLLKEAQDTYSNSKIYYSQVKGGDKNATLREQSRQVLRPKVIVLVATESRYFGTIVASLATSYVAELKEGNTDAVVVGKIAYDALIALGISPRNFTYFDFNDEKPDWTLIPKIDGLLANYVEIIIFYGKYKSILTQEVQREDIAKNIAVKAPAELKKYEIEGDHKGALALLEKQILSSSFLQKLYENGLAKNAVVVKVLEIGIIAERINTAFSQLAKWKLRFVKESNNRKQTQLYGSRSLWEKSGIWGDR